MEKVMCIKCGSIGYTASPEQVACSECGGKHKIITEKYEILRPVRRFGLLSILRLARG